MNVPQYITQLTKSWIVDVSKKIVQGTCIRVDESGESRVISVDVEALKQFLDVGDIGDGTFVTTDTAQDVTGVKTFKGSQPVNLDANGGNFTRLRFTQGNNAIGYIGVYDHTSPCDDMLGTVILGGNGGTGQGILIGSTSSGPEVRLRTAPTSHDSTTSLSVPTMGWVNDKFIRKSQIGVSGGVAAFGHSHSGYAASNHSHSGYAASNHSHSEYATTTALNTLTSATESLTELVGGIQEQIGSLEIENLKAAIDEYAAAKKTSVEAEIQAAGREVLDNLDGYATVTEVEEELEDYVLKTSLYDNGNNPLYVTTSTAQTVTGEKTFKGSQPVNLDANTAQYARIRFIKGNSTLGYVGSYLPGVSGAQPWAKTKCSVLWGGGASGDSQCLLVGTHDEYGACVQILNNPNSDTLASTSTSLKVVPTMGWVNDKFIRKDKGPDADPATEDKVLMLKKGATAYTEETAEFAPKSPTSSIQLNPSLISKNADGTTWTYSGSTEQGLVVYLATRLRWDGTDLVEFRRPFTFSKNGMLYSVGSEEKHIIDTPTKITWS